MTADRLTPQREAEIGERAATRAAALTAWLDKFSPLSEGQREVENAETVLVEDVPALLAELAAVRAERDCLALAVLFARQWRGGTPFELHKGIDEVLATMPSSGAGETA